jgi:hypothetical protein
VRVDEVVSMARVAHEAHWAMTGIEGEGDRRASRVTSEWQTAVVSRFGDDFVAEYPVGDGLGERIDLVDTKDGVAFELKVSPNNPHFEFYRDIFKAAVARDLGLPALRTFVFVTPEEAARTLDRTFVQAAVRQAERLGLTVMIRGI